MPTTQLIKSPRRQQGYSHVYKPSPKGAERLLICYLCGRGFSAYHLEEHFAPCMAQRRAKFELVPSDCRPVHPMAPNQQMPKMSASLDEIERYNEEAQRIYYDHLAMCTQCGRRFEPDRLSSHIRACQGVRGVHDGEDDGMPARMSSTAAAQWNARLPAPPAGPPVPPAAAPPAGIPPSVPVAAAAAAAAAAGHAPPVVPPLRFDQQQQQHQQQQHHHHHQYEHHQQRQSQPAPPPPPPPHYEPDYPYARHISPQQQQQPAPAAPPQQQQHQQHQQQQQQHHSQYSSYPSSPRYDSPDPFHVHPTPGGYFDKPSARHAAAAPAPAPAPASSLPPQHPSHHHHHQHHHHQQHQQHHDDSYLYSPRKPAPASLAQGGGSAPSALMSPRHAQPSHQPSHHPAPQPSSSSYYQPAAAARPVPSSPRMSDHHAQHASHHAAAAAAPAVAYDSLDSFAVQRSQAGVGAGLLSPRGPAAAAAGRDRDRGAVAGGRERERGGGGGGRDSERESDRRAGSVAGHHYDYGRVPSVPPELQNQGAALDRQVLCYCCGRFFEPSQAARHIAGCPTQRISALSFIPFDQRPAAPRPPVPPVPSQWSSPIEIRYYNEAAEVAYRQNIPACHRCLKQFDYLDLVEHGRVCRGPNAPLRV